MSVTSRAEYPERRDRYAINQNVVFVDHHAKREKREVTGLLTMRLRTAMQLAVPKGLNHIRRIAASCY